MRAHLIQECARLIVQDGISDYQIAKKRALAQLGLVKLKNLPSNQEIEQAVMAYQQLFKPVDTDLLLDKYSTALNAMTLLKAFRPHLVGKLLRGLAQTQDEIILHLFHDDSEAVAHHLINQHIPYRTDEYQYKSYCYPAYHFLAGEQSLMLVVFAVNDLRWSPLDVMTNKPMQRINREQVKQTINQYKFYYRTLLNN